MIAADRQFAVLTGDLVDSSKLSAAESRAALQTLQEAAERFAATVDGAPPAALDTFRHDSWQWPAPRPELAVRAALYLRAALKMTSPPKRKLDTRIAIGIGTVEELDTQRVSNSRGPAFTASGKALDGMKDRRLTLAAAQELQPALEELASGSIPLLDCIVSGWTPKEARVVRGALLGWTQEQTAEHWPPDSDGKRITRQAVGRSLARAHWNRVEAYLEWVESTVAARLGTK